MNRDQQYYISYNVPHTGKIKPAPDGTISCIHFFTDADALVTMVKELCQRPSYTINNISVGKISSPKK